MEWFGEVINLCAIVSYDALIDFIRHYSKSDSHKYKEQGWKKNDMNLYLEFSRTSTTKLFWKNSKRLKAST